MEKINKRKILAKFQCLKCGHKWESKPGPTSCVKCNHVYIKWLNYSEFSKLLDEVKR